MTPQARAGKSAKTMMANDEASRHLKMRMDGIGPGSATLSMDVTPQMLNGHKICHGGYIFTLADSAFAFACNTYNQMTLAQQNQITFLSPATLGERLSAVAVEASKSGRSGTYDVTITGSDGRKVALMRGLSRTVKGHHFHEDGSDL